MSKLYTYIVREDSGFAPNPFHGFCTLATCKPRIRKIAKDGDWIAGFSSKRHYKDRRLVYAMRVEKVLDFDEYWTDTRFKCKQPIPTGDREQQCGDNIYHRNPDDGSWIQAPSYHDETLIEWDTRFPQALISKTFVYYGAKAIKLPSRFRNWNGQDISPMGRGHRCNFPDDLREEFVGWLASQADNVVHGKPTEWLSDSCSPRSYTPSKSSNPSKQSKPRRSC